MCGILALIEGIRVLDQASHACTELLQHLELSDFEDVLTSRGPDSQGSSTLTCGAATLQLSSSLLQLRGSSPVQPPHHHDATGNILLWNGEIFGGLDVQPGQNDGSVLLETLSSKRISESSCIPEILSSLRGPWAIVFWQAETSTLWFGRDVMGRRSLLMHLPNGFTESQSDDRELFSQMILTSAPPLSNKSIPAGSFIELPPGIYSLSFAAAHVTGSNSQVCKPRPTTIITSNNLINTRIIKHEWIGADLSLIQAYERGQVPLNPELSSEAAAAAAAQVVLETLQHAVNVRCQYSDTFNVSGNAFRYCVQSFDKLNLGDCVRESSEVEQFLKPARVLILFSGGVDSTLLAVLAHKALPEGEPIDLASVCFDSGNSPDRLAALDALSELREIAPTRPWRLIAVNKHLDDIDAIKPRLLRLLAPADTVMDLNIGSALWLAACGQGSLLACYNEDENIWKGRAYTSAARIVFLGHGADELFGGYSRHRTRYRNGGWEGLSEELALDVRRLWKRNLGRDDRLIADCSREGRHPFLDEAVIKLVLSYPLPSLVNMDLPAGKGDKRVLRDILRQLGAPRAAERVKRAIQFGSRLAKRTNEREFGGTRQANSRNAGKVKLETLASINKAA